MKKTGALLKCKSGAPPANFPLYDRQAYKSGDPIKLPYFTINGVSQDMYGVVQGKSSVGRRSVLVVDVAESRQEKLTDPNNGSVFDAHLTASGHVYLDLATGFPLEAELSMEATGAFPALDRMKLYIHQELMLN